MKAKGRLSSKVNTKKNFKPNRRLEAKKQNINFLQNDFKKCTSSHISKSKDIKRPLQRYSTDQTFSKFKFQCVHRTMSEKNNLFNNSVENEPSNNNLVRKEDKFNFIHDQSFNLQNVFNNPMNDSENIFKWLIDPLTKSDFFTKNWETKPLHIKRSKAVYYKDLISSHLIDKILRENYISFTKNLDVTSFANDKRETHNPQGRALPSVIWDYFLNGCSVRILNPQTYIPELHSLNASLQELFHCFVGSNSYLTPPNSQGFAPHYDDIEAFILQVEGRKRWRLYKPRYDEETLPRYSSPNFSQKDLGEPILDTIVEPGDLLYFPRGIIHQGDTFGLRHHSLHVTLSVYQKNTWGDFLEKLIPSALQNAMQSDVRFRKGLPLYYLRHIGFAFENKNLDVHKKFLSQIQSLLRTLVSKYLNIDETADRMAKHHIHDFLPPMFTKQEYLCSVYGGGEQMTENGTIINRVKIKPSTCIRLSRAHCIRLVMESDSYRLYYSCDNSKEFHEYELQYLEVHHKFVNAMKKIISEFPSYIKVKDLPIKNLNDKVQFVTDLWEKGILICERPLF